MEDRLPQRLHGQTCIKPLGVETIGVFQTTVGVLYSRRVHPIIPVGRTKSNVRTDGSPGSREIQTQVITGTESVVPPHPALADNGTSSKPTRIRVSSTMWSPSDQSHHRLRQRRPVLHPRLPVLLQFVLRFPRDLPHLRLLVLIGHRCGRRHPTSPP